jgi:hypothetical protein
VVLLRAAAPALDPARGRAAGVLPVVARLPVVQLPVKNVAVAVAVEGTDSGDSGS